MKELPVISSECKYIISICCIIHIPETETDFTTKLAGSNVKFPIFPPLMILSSMTFVKFTGSEDKFPLTLNVICKVAMTLPFDRLQPTPLAPVLVITWKKYDSYLLLDTGLRAKYNLIL